VAGEPPGGGRYKGRQSKTKVLVWKKSVRNSELQRGGEDRVSSYPREGSVWARKINHSSRKVAIGKGNTGGGGGETKSKDAVKGGGGWFEHV